jgi:LuxR family transcriptional regulator, maltose regulon positive regulatory protein
MAHSTPVLPNPARPALAVEAIAQTGSGDVALPPSHPPLLMTKLFVPVPPMGLVTRPQLLTRLNAGLAGQLTLLSAPPGFGKTTLLTQWLATCGGPVAWLSLEASDSDPASLVRYLIAAFQTLAPPVGQTTLALLQAPQPPNREILLSLLINDLTAQLPPAILVLDDYHVLQGTHVHQLMGFLIEHLPPQLHLVIATREDPPLPLARLRTRRQMHEVRASDLRFTPDEAATFLNTIMGLPLSGPHIAALEERTEGWIAGLHLAALALRDHADTGAFLAAFTGSHRYVFDYLVEEVFKRQPAAVQAFLLATSILDRLCGELCDAVLEPLACAPAVAGDPLPMLSAPAQTILEQLEHANLFLIPLDSERRWYRYHHLFADLLRVRVRQSWPALLPELQRRASAWLAEAGLAAEAIQHALAIPDPVQAAKLISQNAEPMVMRGDFTTLHRWLAALPTPLYQTHPRLLLMRAWTQFLVEPYGAEAVEDLLHEAEAILATTVLAPEEQTELRGIVAAIRSAVAGNQEARQQALRLAEEALALLPPDNGFWRLIPTVNLGLAHDAGGAVAAASARFAEALAMAQRARNPYVTLITTIHLGRVRAAQGQLHEAARLYRTALTLANQWGWDRLPMVGLPHVWLAKVLYEWNDLTAATKHATAGLEPVQFNEHRRILLEAYATLARIRQAQGELTEAQALMVQAVAVAESATMQWAAPRVAAYQARGWLAQGQVSRAAQWLQSARLNLSDELTSQREYEQITLARVLIALGQPGEALPFLARMAAAAEQAGRLRSLLEIWLLAAQAHAAQGESAQAQQLLHQALVLAEPEGYIRSFVDEGAGLATLLKQLDLREGQVRAYRDRLLAAFPTASEPAPPPSRPAGVHPELVETLSAREIEVLRLMAAGLSNAEIAETLVIALSTVKRHVHNICSKLDAHTRTAVIARARTLDLL